MKMFTGLINAAVSPRNLDPSKISWWFAWSSQMLSLKTVVPNALVCKDWTPIPSTASNLAFGAARSSVQ